VTEALEVKTRAETAEVQKTVIAKSKPILKRARTRSSTLSLSSIERERQLSAMEVDFDEIEGKPTDPFTEEEILDHWKKYVDHLFEQGKKSVASIMNTGTPAVEGNDLHFQVANAVMKTQLEHIQGGLLKYLREQLNNFKIDLVIEVNAEKTQRLAYTPQEKYEKLKEKNPVISKLRKSLDLEL
jgi:DNA polymerase-3 subunit gamma/tau